MKVLFIMKYPLVDQYSIMQKLNGEINAVRKLGHTPYFISFDREHLYLDDGEKRSALKKTTLGHAPNYFHTLVFYDIYTAARKAIIENEFDIVYFRHSPLNYLGYRMIKAAHSRSKLLVEISSFPPYTEKAKNTFRMLYHALSKKWWDLSAKYVSLFTGIGDHAEQYLGKPFLNINNGIDVELIPERIGKKPADQRIHLLAVASMCEWHGYERIITGLANWKDEKASEYIVDFVGDEGDGSLEKWKKLVKDRKLDNQVVFHGRLTGDALTEIYNTATVGISSLAMYKIGFSTGSVLKLREYMARGLPFIYAHEDPDITYDMPWCVHIPNDDSPVDMQIINDFVARINADDQFSHKMREYAREHMSWEGQFSSIFAFMREKNL